MNTYSKDNSSITKVEDLDIEYGRYSYADYLTWQFDEMVELIRGKLYRMAPAPMERHQRVAGELFVEIKINLKKDQKCRVYHAPFDVRLPLHGKKDEEITTVVQPDICVICDRSKIDEKGCLGAPDLIIEILSPNTARKDMVDKLKIYEASGIKEYWIVEPSEQFIMVYILVEGRYKNDKNYFPGDVLNSHAVKGFSVDLGGIFDLKTD